MIAPKPQPEVTDADRRQGAGIVRGSSAPDREAMARRMTDGELDDCPLLRSLAMFRVHGITALQQAAPDGEGRCRHGVRHPWQCDECDAADPMPAGYDPTAPAKPDNPPAFPWQILTNGTTDGGGSGMTLWDHFAGQALAGQFPVLEKLAAAKPSWTDRQAYEQLAKMAGDIADAMLAERQRRGL